MKTAVITASGPCFILLLVQSCYFRKSFLSYIHLLLSILKYFIRGTTGLKKCTYFDFIYAPRLAKEGIGLTIIFNSSSLILINFVASYHRF